MRHYYNIDFADGQHGTFVSASAKIKFVMVVRGRFGFRILARLKVAPKMPRLLRTMKSGGVLEGQDVLVLPAIWYAQI